MPKPFLGTCYKLVKWTGRLSCKKAAPCRSADLSPSHSCLSRQFSSAEFNLSFSDLLQRETDPALREDSIDVESRSLHDRLEPEAFITG